MADDEYSLTERLDLYVWRCQQLLDEPAVKTGEMSLELSLRFEAAKPLRVTSKEPDEPLFRSFLVAFRPFVSDSEPIFANRVARLVLREVRSDKIKGDLISARDQWKQACRAGAFRLVENGRPLEPEEIMDIWLNGQYFHNDKRKIEAISRLDPLSRIISRHAFLNHVLTACNYIMFLGQVIIVARKQGLLDH